MNVVAKIGLVTLHRTKWGWRVQDGSVVVSQHLRLTKALDSFLARVNQREREEEDE